MPDPLAQIRDLVRTPADAIRWACILEATAPKAGNVYPGRPFSDLTYTDFIAAAEITACQLADQRQPMSLRMVDTVEQTFATTGTNVNLGIVLLLGPLVGADELRDQLAWEPAIKQFLSSLTETDGQNIYRAIVAASPGGLGSSESNDVTITTGPVDIVAAMGQSSERDRIARQYATGFVDLIDNVVPVVRDSISQSADLLHGIAAAQLRLLAVAPDSLIARKCGSNLAMQVRDRAKQINISDRDAIRQFDAWLREDGHRRNPGTTADLIAASLYLIMRTNEH